MIRLYPCVYMQRPAAQREEEEEEANPFFRNWHLSLTFVSFLFSAWGLKGVKCTVRLERRGEEEESN